MKKIYSIITLTCTLLLASCNSFLNEEPSNATTADNAIGNATDAQVIINGIMRTMTSASYYGRNFFMYGDAKGGDLTIKKQSGRGLDDLYSFNHSATSGTYSGFWENRI